LHIAMIFAGPCETSGAGSGTARRGLPVGPSSASAADDFGAGSGVAAAAAADVVAIRHD